MFVPADPYLIRFERRANRRLAALAHELAGALASGDEAAVVQLLHEGALLTHGLASVFDRANSLSAEERRYIVDKLLPAAAELLPAPPVYTVRRRVFAINGRPLAINQRLLSAQ